METVTVRISFQNQDLSMSLELADLELHNRTPRWDSPETIKGSRVVDAANDMLMIFKEATISRLELRVNSKKKVGVRGR